MIRVILDNPPASHWVGPAMLNALRFTGLAEVAAMNAPREMVALLNLPREYDLTTKVCPMLGQPGGVRRAYALRDALRVWEQ